MAQAAIATLLDGLASPDSGARERAADEVTDVHRGVTDAEVNELATALTAALLREAVPSCQEAELNALSELKAWHVLEVDLRPLAALRGRLQPAHVEYLDELLGEPPVS